MTFGPLRTLAAFDKLACDEISLFGSYVVHRFALKVFDEDIDVW